MEQKKSAVTSERKLFIEMYFWINRTCKSMEKMFGKNTEIYSPFGWDTLIDFIGFPEDNTLEYDFDVRDEWPDDCFCRDYLYHYIDDDCDEAQVEDVLSHLERELEELKLERPNLFDGGASND